MNLDCPFPYLGFPGGSEVKNPPANAGDAGEVRDLGLILGSGRSPGGGNGNPLQYSCLENPMDRGVCGATVHGVANSQTRLSDFTHSLMQLLGLPWWLRGQSICRQCGFNPWVRKIPWRRAQQPTPVFLLGVFYGQRSLAGYSPYSHKIKHD